MKFLRPSVKTIARAWGRALGWRPLLVGCAFVLQGCGSAGPLSSPQEPTALAGDANQIKAHMAFLADDALLGREPGTPGYDTAADYVAMQFKRLGLAPAGDKASYFQQVRLRRSLRVADAVALSAVDGRGKPLSLQEGVDYVVGGSLRQAESSVTAPVVFVGYGLVAPELGRDDYAGLDVRGKVVAMLQRTPSGLQSEERAFYGAMRSVEASRRGAVAIISLATTVSEKIYPFARLVNEKRMDSSRMGWVNAQGEVHTRAPNLRASAVFSIPGSERLFANAPTSYADVLEAAGKEGGVTPTFELDVSVSIAQRSTHDEITSANVLGMIEGADPRLRSEVLLLSAHLDHLGVSTVDGKDTINNGALDNAAGVATMLDAARMLMAGPRPRRTVVFLANTAEETGLLGAQFFAKHPTLGDKSIVANINLDMPLLTYDFQDVVVFGGNRSTLRDAIAQAADQMGIGIGEDPFPEQGIFTRSDHFRFVEEGIPSVMLATGMANGGQAAWAEHFEHHYHQPSDDMENNLDFSAAAKFSELKTRIALTVANADRRPLWRKGDFFARQFDGPMQD